MQEEKINASKNGVQDEDYQRDLYYYYDPGLFYEVNDIGLATALVCSGFDVLFIDVKNNKNPIFIFELEQGPNEGEFRITNTADLYFLEKLAVNAKSYFDNLKALKSRLYTL